MRVSRRGPVAATGKGKKRRAGSRVGNLPTACTERGASPTWLPGSMPESFARCKRRPGAASSDWRLGVGALLLIADRIQVLIAVGW